MVNEEGSSYGCHVIRESASDVQNKTAASAHFALFVGNEGDDWNQQKKRKRFNFNHARWAVKEANRSVMEQARKHN
ncbi:hypothetical protein Hanom_Chr09g00822451 [Helianthus anomalus]